MTISSSFHRRESALRRAQRRLLGRRNAPRPGVGNGIFERYRFPVLTADHVPLEWRFDLDPRSNPHLMERLGVNAVFNAGAIDWRGGVCLAARLEGWDRKSFFAIAESRSGVDGFRFWDEPLVLPEAGEPDDNVYDMRLTRHADGWIYGVFCSERKDPAAPPGDTSSAIARAGIARSRDLKTWERLPDLQTASPQQRNVVLHPEFVDGKYAFYTRPMDGFIDVGSGGGIGWGLCADITRPALASETIIDEKRYHTIKESKNGAGAPPIKTPAGWLHIAHGVRNTAAGLRYVLYALLCDLDQPWRVVARPGGYLMAPEGEERLGDVSNVLFCNGVVARPGGQVLIYYGASDTRTHVAATTVDRLLDYVTNTPEDGLRTATCVRQRLALIEKNRARGSR